MSRKHNSPISVLMYVLQVNLIAFSAIAFCALTLLVGEQEGHPTCKTELWGAGVVICLGEVQICIWPS